VRPFRAALIGANLIGLGTVAALGGWDVIQLHTGIGLPERSAPPMELVAHRGDLDRHPENTLEAIVAATELDLDGIEFDVVESADGTWWVIHDPSLERTTNHPGWIPDLADLEIMEAVIDGGIGFDASTHRGLRVPRLEDVLTALERYEGTIYVDVQHAPTGSVDAIVELLDGRDAAILCRNLDDSRRVKALDASIETYLRAEDGPADGSVDGWLMESYFEADVGTLETSELPIITFVDQWRAGQDEEPLIRRAWAIGVTAFLTKEPARALDVRAELASTQ